VKFARQSLAAFVLSVWLLAVGHVAMEHCAAMNGGCVVACHAHTDGGHHGEPEGEGDGHHHHFTTFASSPFAKDLDFRMPALWSSSDRALTECLLEILRVSAEPSAMLASWESPPDERAAGWLLDCHTARPVRGPSLAA
jgi:hypothetical protein